MLQDVDQLDEFLASAWRGVGGDDMAHDGGPDTDHDESSQPSVRRLGHAGGRGAGGDGGGGRRAGGGAEGGAEGESKWAGWCPPSQPLSVRHTCFPWSPFSHSS